MSRIRASGREARQISPGENSESSSGVAAPSPLPIAEKPSADRKSKRRATVAANSNPNQQVPDSGSVADSAPQSAPAAPTESPSTDATQPATDAPAESPAPIPATAVAADTASAAPEPKDIEIPAGTSIRVRMIDPVNSSVNKTGEVFHASLEYPIVVNNDLVVPKGADVYIRLTRASSAGAVTGRSELHLELVKLDYGGRSYALVSSTSSVVGGSKAKKTATAIGAGAVIGGIIGAIAGGGRGAAIGAGVGGAGGGVYAASTKGAQVKVPAETLLDFKLEQPATVTVPPHTGVSGE